MKSHLSAVVNTSLLRLFEEVVGDQQGLTDTKP
jgi:hypothetical protein